MISNIKDYNKHSERATKPGCRFNMDFDFVRGKEITKNEDGPLITSKEGYNCYVSITHKFSRHLCVFLFANKSPPIATITPFLSTHGLKTGLRQVQTY